MRMRYINIIVALLVICTARISAQPDPDPPVSPVLKLVTVSQASGFSEISWALSPSPDV
jgi:hypothetical protein